MDYLIETQQHIYDQLTGTFYPIEYSFIIVSKRNKLD
jgi:hypothetical protein